MRKILWSTEFELCSEYSNPEWGSEKVKYVFLKLFIFRVPKSRLSLILRQGIFWHTFIEKFRKTVLYFAAFGADFAHFLQ